MSLATTDDLEVRLGRALTGTEVDRAEALLAGASARVQTYTGQTFTLVENDTVTVKVRNRIARLPQRPVTAVDAVTDPNDNTIGFTWLGDDRVQVGNGLDYSWVFEPWRNGLNLVTVTYSHGYTTVPADVVDVVCQMAGRAMTRSADETGLTQESIAGYSYSVGSAAASGSVGMLPDERAALDVYRRRLGSIRIGL